MTFTSFSVSVPATSANLGPGYDSCGMALDLRDVVAVAPESGPVTRVEITGEGAQTLPTDESHLIVRIIRETLARLSEGDPGPLHLVCHNVIPHSRGLGSSAAAVVAGIVAAYAIAGREPDAGEMLEFAVDYEGHPDNAAPAIRGGASLSLCTPPSLSVDLVVHEDLSAVVMVPGVTLETSVARGLLPREVPHTLAAENSARTGLLVHALASGRHLFEGTADLLHQDFRRPAMPETLRTVDALRSEGLAAFVSGAGPTLAVLGVEPPEELTRLAASALPEDQADMYAIRALRVAAEGAQVCYT